MKTTKNETFHKEIIKKEIKVIGRCQKVSCSIWYLYIYCMNPKNNCRFILSQEKQLRTILKNHIIFHLPFIPIYLFLVHMFFEFFVYHMFLVRITFWQKFHLQRRDNCTRFNLKVCWSVLLYQQPTKKRNKRKKWAPKIKFVFVHASLLPRLRLFDGFFLKLQA